MSKSMKYVNDFRSVPGHREAPYARIIDIRYFSEETNKTGMRAIDAVITILYHYDIKQLNVFLDPVVTTFNFSGNTLGFDVIIRRRAKVVTIGYQKDGQWREGIALYRGSDDLTGPWEYVEGDYLGGWMDCAMEEPSDEMRMFAMSFCYNRVWTAENITCTSSNDDDDSDDDGDNDGDDGDDGWNTTNDDDDDDDDINLRPADRSKDNAIEAKAKSPANATQPSPASQPDDIKDADIGTKTSAQGRKLKALFASDDF